MPKTSPQAKADADFAKQLGSMFGPKAAATAKKTLTFEEQIAADAASEMRWLDADDLEDNPWQTRESYDASDIEEMKESLNAVGQIQPGIARPHPTKPGKFQIAVAHRRTRGVQAGGNAGTGRPNAHLYIGKVWMRVADLNDMEMRVLVTRENSDRVDPNPMEYARSYSNIRDLLGEGQKRLTWADVSKLTGLGIRQMRRYADLLDLPEAAQKKIREGAWNERHGRAILSFDDEARQQILMRAIDKEGLSGSAAEKRSGTMRAAYATQREMDIADTAQKSHETHVAQQGAQVQQENRAALEAGQSPFTLVPPVETPRPTSEAPSLPSQESSSASAVANAVAVEPRFAPVEESREEKPPIPTPPADPVGELQNIAARIEFLAQDLASLAVVSPLLRRGVQGGTLDCYESLRKILAAVDSEVDSEHARVQEASGIETV